MSVLFILVALVMIFFYATLATGWFMKLYLKRNPTTATQIQIILKEGKITKRLLFPLLQEDWSIRKQRKSLNGQNTTTILFYIVFWLSPMIIMLLAGMFTEVRDFLFIPIYGLTIHLVQVGVILKATRNS